MANPQLISEVDFGGNPTATYHDTFRYDDDTVSYWRFASAAALTDELAANSGTIVGAPTLAAGALPFDTDQALAFNGTADGATVPSSQSLLQPGSFSLVGWVKVPSIPGATKDLAVKPGTFGVRLLSTGQLQVFVKNEQSGTVTLTTVTSNTKLATGGYYHVQLVHDVGKELRLYVNGIKEQAAAHTVGIELNGNPLLFGVRHGTTAPAVAGTATTSFANAVTALTTNAPAGIVSGELLIAQITMSGTGHTLTPPTGWSVWSSDDGTDPAVWVYYKIATGAEPASYTWTAGAAVNYSMGIFRVSGVDTSHPFANPPYTNRNSGPTTIPTLSHQPNYSNVLAVAMYGSAASAAFSAVDSGATLIYNVGANRSCAGAVLQIATPATVNITATQAAQAHQATLMFINGTGSDFAACTLDDWAFLKRAQTDDQAKDAYEARLSGLSGWTDVSVDSRSFETQRGRQYELDKIEAGTLAEVLKDAARNYDPANQAGAHWPNVIPKRRTRKRATVGANTYPVFQGYVERWPVDWITPEYEEVKITAADGLGPLALAPVAGTVPAGLSGAQINKLLDMARWPSADRAIDTGQFSMVEWALPAGQFALQSIQEIADSELGIFFMSADGKATFHDNAHRWTQSRSLTPQATFADVDGQGIRYVDLIPSFDDDHTINQWQVATSAGTVAIASDVVGARRSFPLAQQRTTRLDAVADAQTQALALLQETARPGLRFDTLILSPTTDADWQAVLALEISDLVTVIRNPPGNQIKQNCFVEGIRVSGNPTVWQVELELSPVSPATYFDTIVRDGPVSYWRNDTVT